jgi:hypothetical protein
MYLLGILERIAKRLETFYTRLATHSIYAPEIEKNPARTRWNLLRRKIFDGSFFILTGDLQLDFSASSPKAFRSMRHQNENIDFSRVISQVKQAINIEPLSLQNFQPEISPENPMRLADNHMNRAAPNPKAPSSFEQHEQSRAMNRMSKFIDSNMQSIKRLSQLPTNVDFAHLMSVYGSQQAPAPSPKPNIPTRHPQPQIHSQTLHHRRTESKASDTRHREISNASMSGNLRSRSTSLGRRLPIVASPLNMDFATHVQGLQKRRPTVGSQHSLPAMTHPSPSVAGNLVIRRKNSGFSERGLVQRSFPTISGGLP